tara:strand:- start:5820 stop:6089 length:270 start_codon:yes stop_codon:yes gene_type:complete
MTIIRQKQYKLSDTDKKRRETLESKIRMDAKRRKITLREAAISKKSRLNILRIYRRYRNFEHCKIITSDMIWITKKFIKNGKTNKICSK